MKVLTLEFGDKNYTSSQITASKEAMYALHEFQVNYLTELLSLQSQKEVERYIAENSKL